MPTVLTDFTFINICECCNKYSVLEMKSCSRPDLFYERKDHQCRRRRMETQLNVPVFGLNSETRNFCFVRPTLEGFQGIIFTR